MTQREKGESAVNAHRDNIGTAREKDKNRSSGKPVTKKKEADENWLTKAFVGGLIAVALVISLYYLVNNKNQKPAGVGGPALNAHSEN